MSKTSVISFCLSLAPCLCLNCRYNVNPVNKLFEVMSSCAVKLQVWIIFHSRWCLMSVSSQGYGSNTHVNSTQRLSNSIPVFLNPYSNQINCFHCFLISSWLLISFTIPHFPHFFPRSPSPNTCHGQPLSLHLLLLYIHCCCSFPRRLLLLAIHAKSGG